VDRAIYHEFAESVAGADRDVDLFGAAMAIAKLRGGPVDPHATARELDLIAEAAREAAGEGATVESLAGAIDHELFAVRGFHGNATDYGDPQNSYLDRVVERRAGIPITLSLVFMEVAARVGLRCDGVGFPGHFLVRCGGEDGFFVDPFRQGARPSREDLLAQLGRFDLGTASPESYLLAVTRRQMLQRMLNNLRAGFRERRDVERWLGTVEMLVCLEPWNAALVGERGMLYYRSGEAALALEDLQRYVSAAEPESVNSGALRLLDELRLQLGGSKEPK